ncbi:putative myosin-binding protein 5 [Curcuma longa]|uniref:putative myosin-binding protein 5 n=1 Tax=Curcuma longa TaxID=136217 RepID=UPI003D9F88D0
MAGAAESLGFFAFYKTSICECFLIAFLLHNAALAYLATRFARFCNLPPPCLLCSRLDNLLGGGGERHGFYKSLFCHAHKVEISSMVYCHDHKKLGDLRAMCRACLLSSTTVPAAGHETYTLLGRKLLTKPDDEYEGDGAISSEANPPSSNHKLRPTPAGTSVCSCCSATFQRPPTKKKQTKRARAVEPYDELKLPSDSDSEASLSENCDGYPLSRATKAAKEKSGSRRRLPPSLPFSYRTSPKIASTEKVPEKLIHPCTPGAMKLNGEVKNHPEQVHRSNESSVRGNSFKKALGNRGFILSPRFSEMVAGKESSRAQEDLKQRLSRALDSLWSNEATASPRTDDLKPGDASAAALQSLASRFSITRSNSSMDVRDCAAIVSDVEGETSIARLKQQVEMDRKSISALCKELEEERSASTVAVNEAMAMITRLQEEKAAMQMEASQYLRLLEEQAEYDQEAIEKLNELLDEREKECLEMEAELEARDSSSSFSTKLCGAACGVKDLLLNLEQEKFQVSDSLKRLQKKLALFSAKQPPPPPLAGEETGEEDPEIGSLKDEVSRLIERMEAIEEDREFLGQALAALRHGAEGIELVQEIARQLKGLRRALKQGIMAKHALLIDD